MRSFWANLESLTIPSSANPGDTRIVIGGALPAPLDTYTWVGPFGDSYEYVSALIFYYGGGNDNNYVYIAPAHQVGGANNFMEWQVGAVVNGAVKEMTAGFPAVFQILEQLTGGTISQKSILADVVEVSGAALANRLLLGSNGAVQLETDTGASIGIGRIGDQDYIIMQSGSVVITTAISGADVLVTSGGDVSVTSPSQITLSAGSGDVVVSSDINWSGSTAVTSGLVNTVGVGTSSTSYGLLGVTVGVVFVAPPSGKVLIHFSGRLSNSVAGNQGFFGPEVRAGSTIGSGTVFQAVTDGKARRMQSGDNTEIDKAGMTTEVTGLTAGNTYNVSLWSRSGNAANSTSVNDNEVVVQPVF